jgi:hypothetical protein
MFTESGIQGLVTQVVAQTRAAGEGREQHEVVEKSVAHVAWASMKPIRISTRCDWYGYSGPEHPATPDSTILRLEVPPRGPGDALEGGKGSVLKVVFFRAG